MGPRRRAKKELSMSAKKHIKELFLRSVATNQATLETCLPAMERITLYMPRLFRLARACFFAEMVDLRLKRNMWPLNYW